GGGKKGEWGDARRGAWNDGNRLRGGRWRSRSRRICGQSLAARWEHDGAYRRPSGTGGQAFASRVVSLVNPASGALKLRAVEAAARKLGDPDRGPRHHEHIPARV